MLEYETANPGQDASRAPTMYQPNHGSSSPHPGDDVTASNTAHNTRPETDGANADYSTSNSNAEQLVVSKPVPAGLKQYQKFNSLGRKKRAFSSAEGNLMRFSEDSAYRTSPETEAQNGQAEASSAPRSIPV